MHCNILCKNEGTLIICIHLNRHGGAIGCEAQASIISRIQHELGLSHKCSNTAGVEHCHIGIASGIHSGKSSVNRRSNIPHYILPSRINTQVKKTRRAFVMTTTALLTLNKQCKKACEEIYMMSNT